MNNINLIGRLTKDPRIEITRNEKFYVLFNLACRENKNRTNFIPCIAFDKTAETIGDYLHKGDKIYAQGVLQSSVKDNNYSLIVNVTRFEFAESASKSKPAASDNNTSTESKEPNISAEYFEIDDAEAYDEDIPF